MNYPSFFYNMGFIINRDIEEKLSGKEIKNEICPLNQTPPFLGEQGHSVIIGEACVDSDCGGIHYQHD